MALILVMGSTSLCFAGKGKAYDWETGNMYDVKTGENGNVTVYDYDNGEYHRLKVRGSGSNKNVYDYNTGDFTNVHVRDRGDGHYQVDDLDGNGSYDVRMR